MPQDHPSPLSEYRQKRDPHSTPEPFGGPARPTGSLLVIQKHRARRLHYDFRLEIDGVLKSWAVPKGPSTRPEEKRLAVQVEDHPVEYADFEGIIPKGNYGAGEVILWDHGRYRLLKPEDPLKQLKNGKLEVELFGFKLRGAWTLARMSRKEKEWLLIKKADGFARDEEVTERYPESVLSGLTIEELGEASPKLGILRARLADLGAPRGEVLPARQRPMLASLETRPFSDKEWLFEIKYDGVRVLAWKSGDVVELYGRNAQPVGARYPEILRALRALPCERFFIDGEIAALDERGRPSFQRLQARMHLNRPADVERARAEVPVTGFFFDCLALEGHDLRGLKLAERKEILKLLLPRRGIVQYSDHIVEHGEAVFAAAAEQGLEGIVAKKLDSRYRAGRSREWLKLKCQKRQEFVIGGYTRPRGSRGYFGALHLGLYEGKRLVYVSKVGTGFDQASLKTVWDKLQPLARASSPFAAGAPSGREHVWVEPGLVCEVRFTEWTRDGGIRHPAFLGLREDKLAEECRREEPVVIKPQKAKSPPTVEVTNAKKIFWPDEGYTKADLVSYYDAVAPLLLPYLKDRPLVLTRYPDGITGKSFFQKDAPDFVPEWIRTEVIYSDDAERDIRYFVVDDAEALRYIINLGTIPLHIWSSRAPSLDRPDWLILDLDPKGAPFNHVVEVARTLHHILGTLELPHYVKTSGASGLHVMIPLGARYNHEEARTFARLLALLGVDANPDLATVARPLEAREGKVYIDFGQNGHGRTIAAPFSVRPLPLAPVSCPLRWEEVTGRLDPTRFTIKTAPARFQKVGDPMAPLRDGSIDMAEALARVEKKLAQIAPRKAKN